MITSKGISKGIMERKKLDIDDIIDSKAGGVYALPVNSEAPRYKIRELLEYCKEKGIETKHLSDTELKNFKI